MDAVPADSAYPEVEVAEDDAVVCSLVAPACGGDEAVAWCKIRRNAWDAASATIWNLRAFCIYLEITEAEDNEGNNVKIVLDIENAKCSICLNLWHDVVTVAPCLRNFCNGCFSEWLRRSSSNSCDKRQRAACPQCRTAVQSVGRKHFLHNIEASVGLLGKQKNQSRKQHFHVAATLAQVMARWWCSSGTSPNGLRHGSISPFHQ